jgi:DNA-binding HxlR family transcriptional regulator
MRRIHYQPTAAGRALLPVLIEMAYWGAKHDPKTAPPKSFARVYEKDRAGLLAPIKAGSDN